MDKIIYVVGFGPGDKQFMTMQAVEIIEQADLIVGYTTYTDILKAQFPDKKYISTPMRKETDRCRLAIEKALEGNTVAMVSSGDSGIYGMAGIMLEIADDMQADVEIVTVPGITAASTAASVLGAPLMHDLSLISLSDLMTPLELIFRRVEAAASADFVISLYNPKSGKRVDYLEKAADIIMKYRDKGTPVGIVRNAGRPDQKAWLTTLSELKNEPVDMFCVVIVGNSQTYIKNNRMITPRGYKINEQ
ncbi:MAG: precorrin-3B C(17)-methyltransferase [Oscillospiraceae bacterium]|nr:precorrin-3B C(17)-methyltransferase [Oscillospiraceae bacterium]